jgi:phosphatidylserine synthase
MVNHIYRNLPNLASILGIAPLGLLLMPQGYQLLIPIILYNNFMDDLDGVIAAQLNLRSKYGATLDNVCDAVSHTLFVLVAGMHFGGLCAAASAVAAICIILRITSRLESPPQTPKGSATNELIRHLFFVLLLGQLFEFNEAIPLTLIFVLHGFSMLAPFEMPHLIRSRALTMRSVALVNLALLVAWLVPATLAPIAACFIFTYLYSLLTKGCLWLHVPKKLSSQ